MVANRSRSPSSTSPNETSRWMCGSASRPELVMALNAPLPSFIKTGVSLPTATRSRSPSRSRRPMRGKSRQGRARGCGRAGLRCCLCRCHRGRARCRHHRSVCDGDGIAHHRMESPSVVSTNPIAGLGVRNRLAGSRQVQRLGCASRSPLSSSSVPNGPVR